jgi:hypothetical protein
VIFLFTIINCCCYFFLFSVCFFFFFFLKNNNQASNSLLEKETINFEGVVIQFERKKISSNKSGKQSDNQRYAIGESNKYNNISSINYNNNNNSNNKNSIYFNRGTWGMTDSFSWYPTFPYNTPFIPPYNLGYCDHSSYGGLCLCLCLYILFLFVHLFFF